MMCVPNRVISSWSYTPAFYTWGGSQFRFNTFISYGSETWNNHFAGGRIEERPRGGEVGPREIARPRVHGRGGRRGETGHEEAASIVDDSLALDAVSAYGAFCPSQVAQTCIVGETPCAQGFCHSVTGSEVVGQAGICGR